MNAKLWATVGLTAAGVVWLRRLASRWGATDHAVRTALPGDAVVPQPTLQTTHAITVRAPAAAIWPWLVQMGYYRARWYSDPQWWDRLADRYLRSLTKAEVAQSGVGHRDAPSADRILPQFQDLAVGDTILDGPPGTAYFTVMELEPSRALVLYSTTHLNFVLPRALSDNRTLGIHGAFSWAFILNEVNPTNTRLLLRTRATYGPWCFRLVIAPLLMAGEVIFPRRMLRGIKRRAEGPCAVSP
jgi:hypothetical protein